MIFKFNGCQYWRHANAFRLQSGTKTSGQFRSLKMHSDSIIINHCTESTNIDKSVASHIQINREKKSIGTFKPLHISRSNSMTLFSATKIVNWIHSVPLNFEDKSGTLMMYETMLIKLDVLGESINMCAQRSHLATFTFIERLFYWMPWLQHSCNSHNVLVLH